MSSAMIFSTTQIVSSSTKKEHFESKKLLGRIREMDIWLLLKKCVHERGILTTHRKTRIFQHQYQRQVKIVSFCFYFMIVS